MLISLYSLNYSKWTHSFKKVDYSTKQGQQILQYITQGTVIMNVDILCVILSNIWSKCWNKYQNNKNTPLQVM